MTERPYCAAVSRRQYEDTTWGGSHVGCQRRAVEIVDGYPVCRLHADADKRYGWNSLTTADQKLLAAWQADLTSEDKSETINPMTKTTTQALNKLRQARRNLAKERLWIKEHGGSKEGYVLRYGSMYNDQHYGDGGEIIWDADVAALDRAEDTLADLEGRDCRSPEDILATNIVDVSDLAMKPDEVGNYVVLYDGVPAGLIKKLSRSGRVEDRIEDEVTGWEPAPYDGTPLVPQSTLGLAVEAMADHLSKVGTQAYFDLLRERYNAEMRYRDAFGRTDMAKKQFFDIQAMLRSAAQPG